MRLGLYVSKISFSSEIWFFSTEEFEWNKEEKWGRDKE